MTNTTLPDPIDNVEWRDADTLHANAWNPNRVHSQELHLLEYSLLSTGWIQPIIVNPDGLIIDGFHRWRLSQDSAAIKDRWGGKVPVVTMDLDRGEAMLMTIRINRAKGVHVAYHMSAIVRELIQALGYDKATIARSIGATTKEVDLLAQDGVFEHKKIKDWAYSPAWYPTEEDKATTPED